MYYKILILNVSSEATMLSQQPSFLWKRQDYVFRKRQTYILLFTSVPPILPPSFRILPDISWYVSRCCTYYWIIFKTTTKVYLEVTVTVQNTLSTVLTTSVHLILSPSFRTCLKKKMCWYVGQYKYHLWEVTCCLKIVYHLAFKTHFSFATGTVYFHPQCTGWAAHMWGHWSGCCQHENSHWQAVSTSRTWVQYLWLSETIWG